MSWNATWREAALPELAELIKAQDAALPATDEEPADA